MPVFDIITFMPNIYPSFLGEGILGRALEKELWHLNIHHIRDFSINKHRQVDDKPAGGGSGMVLRPDVAAAAFDHCIQNNILDTKREIIYPSAAGVKFDQKMAHDWSCSAGKIILCGRFEGVDQRVLSQYNVTEVSIGDFVLCGGDSAILTMLEASIRLIPGVVGNPTSLEHESFQNGLLEHAHYTVPQQWGDQQIPKILTSGHHQAIHQWRHDNAIERTKERRPDLWKGYCHKDSE